jgi:hypothetical protein
MLEYWNNGIMVLGILQCWESDKIRLYINLKWIISFKTHYSIVPVFHDSMMVSKYMPHKMHDITIQ